MDRQALVLRNQAMAKAYHHLPVKHRIRRALLHALGTVPIPNAKSPTVERILLIRPDHLGDVLLTTPAIQMLRAAYPKAEIHALVGPWSASILANYAEIDVVLTLPFPGFSRGSKIGLRAPYALALRSARQLRKIGYTSAVILRPDHWWGAMLAKWAGIPRRVGYDLPDVAPFLTDAIPHTHQHAVLQNARLIETLTKTPSSNSLSLRFPVDSLDKVWVDAYLQEWDITPEKPIIAIHPGSGTWVKQWSEANWAFVADTLADQLDASVVFTGSDHEMPLVRRILSAMQHPACVMVGEAIGSLAALYERAKIVLGPDSGPLHLAVAVGTPTVTLFGPADPVEFGSWGSPEKHRMVWSSIGCRPCRVLDWNGDAPENHPCVREITPAVVLEAARKAIFQP
ncbi:MAG TPA: glycosyltransferase family 9 protein [Oceanobacillus sp.]|nr:glycosyltransferase family 9 protein [Oceanobacillus sp.]